MEGSEDNASEEWNALVEPIIEKALEEGRIPIECIKYVAVSEDYMAKCVVFHHA